MPLIIDGNNVAGRSRLNERALVERLSKLSRSKQLRMTVVFDGERSHGQRMQSTDKLTVKYAGLYRPADDLILELVSKVSDKHSWVMISDDQELQKQVRELGMKTAGVNTLSVQLQQGDQASKDEQEVEKPVYEAEADSLVQGMMQRRRGKQ